MPSTLLIRLEGPLQSWSNNLGGVQTRPTTPEPSMWGHHGSQAIPTKSGVLGLCAAALGIDRTESVEHLRQLTFGVRVDRQGVPVTEFQTRPHERPQYERRIDARATLNDASFLVGLQGDSELLQRLYCALKNPHWPLSLGRKSYMPARPLFEPGPPVPYALAEALSRAPFTHERYDTRIEDYPRYYVETRAAPVDVQTVEFPGWDEPRSPFAFRKYQPVSAVTYTAIWGEVLGIQDSGPARPQERTTKITESERLKQNQYTAKLPTEEECVQQGLAMYYSKSWFEREFRRLGSLAAMEREYPKYSNQRLSEWAQRHGINLKPRISAKTWAEVDRRLSAGETPGQIAKALSISKPSVQRRAKQE